MRLIYVDDSGDRSMTLYALVEVDESDWAQGLAIWLGARRQLRDAYRIPVRAEIHAVDFLKGRGNPSLDPTWNRVRSHRLEAGRILTEAVSALPARWRVIYRVGGARRETYGAALTDLEGSLRTQHERGLVMIDGDGTDPAYVDAHRRLTLARRHVIEDPWQQPSHSSQWIMVADLVAYLAFQGLRNPHSELGSWYRELLLVRDVHGGPQAA